MAEITEFNRPAPDALGLLHTRRSGSAKAMIAPGPDGDQLRAILAAGARVPDHGKLAPWRFIVFEGAARTHAGAVLADVLKAREPDVSEERLAIERGRFARAPVVVGVVSRAREMLPIPVWEQVLSAGAVCQTMLIAAHAMGFVGNWLTEWCAYEPRVLAAFGLAPGERIAGYLYFGSPGQALSERPRPDLDALITRWRG